MTASIREPCAKCPSVSAPLRHDCSTDRADRADRTHRTDREQRGCPGDHPQHVDVAVNSAAVAVRWIQCSIAVSASGGETLRVNWNPTSLSSMVVSTSTNAAVTSTVCESLNRCGGVRRGPGCADPIRYGTIHCVAAALYLFSSCRDTLGGSRRTRSARTECVARYDAVPVNSSRADDPRVIRARCPDRVGSGGRVCFHIVFVALNHSHSGIIYPVPRYATRMNSSPRGTSRRSVSPASARERDGTRPYGRERVGAVRNAGERDDRLSRSGFSQRACRNMVFRRQVI